MVQYELKIQRMKVFARHGVLPQERTVGADFYVSVLAEAAVEPSAYDDDRLEGTVSYAQLAEAIRQEMQVPSQLLEHVAKRIADRILREHASISRIQVEVEKENPPMGALCQAVGVKITQIR